MARDRRYSSKAWQQLRRWVLARDAYECQVRGPRCTGYADTAHHIRPSSQYPELFWDPENLQASCKPCNYGDGSVIRAGNRAGRQEIAHLERQVEAQQLELDALYARLAEYESGPSPAPARKRRVPRIY